VVESSALVLQRLPIKLSHVPQKLRQISEIWPDQIQMSFSSKVYSHLLALTVNDKSNQRISNSEGLTIWTLITAYKKLFCGQMDSRLAVLGQISQVNLKI